MKKYVDLHLHTNCSDGIRSPLELLEIVRSTNISAFAVTDHDTVEGYVAMKQLVREDDPVLVSGIEMSTTFEDADMHILAYFFDENDNNLISAVKLARENREARGKKMVNKLNEMGIEITYDDVLEQSDGGSVGRPHIARAMHAKNFTSFYEEGFFKYIGDGKPAFVPKQNFTPESAIDLIHRAGGLAFLAHPGIGDKDQYLETLIGYGIDGIEAYHSAHKQSAVDRYLNLAERYRLLVCGGSDFHGYENRHGTVGSQRVPYRYYERIYEKAKKN